MKSPQRFEYHPMDTKNGDNILSPSEMNAENSALHIICGLAVYNCAD